MKMTDCAPILDNRLLNFPSCVRKNVEELCLRSKIGLSQITLADIDVRYSDIKDEDNLVTNYFFTIKIPYAGKTLKWDVIFNPEDFEFTPDFDFNDDEFLPDPEYEMVVKHVPSLTNWSLKNPKALTKVLNEFLLLYKKIQVSKFQNENMFAHYFEEYEALATENINIDDIEVSIDSSGLCFLIPLKVDCSSLPEYIQLPFAEYWKNPGEDHAFLKVCIFKSDGSRVNSSLQISPRLEQFIGKSLHLPEYKRDLTLSEYVKQVSNSIDNRIAFIAEHIKMKNIYITTLAAKCHDCLVEYEMETSDKAAFFHSVKDYHCLIIVTFSSKFPQDKPIITLQSIYCQEGKSCKEILNRYPYKVESSPEENIDMLLVALDEALIKFRSHKHY